MTDELRDIQTGDTFTMAENDLRIVQHYGTIKWPRAGWRGLFLGEEDEIEIPTTYELQVFKAGEWCPVEVFHARGDNQA